MGRKILVQGDPGSGKSLAAKNLNPAETFIICSDRKALPFRGWKKNYKSTYKENGKLDLDKSNYYETDNPDLIVSLMKAISEKRPDIKVIIVDTITAVMENEYMARLKEKGFAKFEDTALHTFNILITPDTLRDDLTVIITAHTMDEMDADGVKKTKFKVAGGKLIGQNITPEGRFTTVLATDVTIGENGPEYSFITQNDGKNTARSQEGCFDLKIPNDYKFVLDQIEKYENGE